MQSSRPAVVNAAFLSVVERVWTRFRAVHPEVPAVRVAVGRRRERTHRLAHYDGDDEPAELFIAIELDGLPPARVFGVLLHEAAHAVAGVRKIKDTSNRGRFHNSQFANLAAELGLHRSPDRPADLGADQLGPAAAGFWKTEIAWLAEAVPRQCPTKRTSGTGATDE